MTSIGMLQATLSIYVHWKAVDTSLRHSHSLYQPLKDSCLIGYRGSLQEPSLSSPVIPLVIAKFFVYLIKCSSSITILILPAKPSSWPSHVPSSDSLMMNTFLLTSHLFAVLHFIFKFFIIAPYISWEMHAEELFCNF